MSTEPAVDLSPECPRLVHIAVSLGATRQKLKLAHIQQINQRLYRA